MASARSGSSGESFVPFLEAMRDNSTVQANDVPREVSIQFLRELDSRGPENVPDLMKSMRIDVVTFANVLKTLEEVGLVEIVSTVGQDLEKVGLTKIGRQLARVNSDG